MEIIFVVVGDWDAANWISSGPSRLWILIFGDIAYGVEGTPEKWRGPIIGVAF
jgi:hypothetical protein